MIGQCDQLKKAAEEICSKDFTNAINSLESFKQEFPNSDLISSIELTLGIIHTDMKDFDKAEKIYKDLINNYKNGSHQSVACGFLVDFIKQENIGTDEELCYFENIVSIAYSDSEESIKHYALLNLSRLYRETNRLEKALTYLDKAQTIGKFRARCGNGIALELMGDALDYAEIYKLMGEPNKALEYLLPVAFNGRYFGEDSRVVQYANEILQENYEMDYIQSELDKSISNLEFEDYTDRDRTYKKYVIYFLDVKISLFCSSKESSKETIQNELVTSGMYKTIFKG